MRGTRDLGAVELLDEHGDRVTMRQLWRDGTALIALVRHFG